MSPEDIGRALHTNEIGITRGIFEAEWGVMGVIGGASRPREKNELCFINELVSK